MRHLNDRDGLLLKQVLLSLEDLLEEVLVHVASWWHEVLKMLIHILVEVGLGLQLPLQLLRLHEADGALLAFLDLVALHLVLIEKFIILFRRGVADHQYIGRPSGNVRDLNLNQRPNEQKSCDGIVG